MAMISAAMSDAAILREPLAQGFFADDETRLFQFAFVDFLRQFQHGLGMFARHDNDAVDTAPFEMINALARASPSLRLFCIIGSPPFRFFFVVVGFRGRRNL